MRTISLLFAIALACSLAAAQTKISISGKCVPGESHSIEAGDHPGHVYTVSRFTCTYTKPFDIAGLKSKDFGGAGFQEDDGNKVREDHSSAVGSMDNGDKYYARAQRTITAKDEKSGIGHGTWNYTGGTGRLKGLKGGGTFKCTPEGDCDLEGEYSLPSK